MRYLKYLALLGVLLFAAGYSQAQVSVGVGIGPVYGGYVAAPVCPYGYYDYYPYDCAPYGYWAPTYFVGGEFIGVGPWYRGRFDRDRYWGDRDRFEHERGFAGDRGRGNFRSFGRSDNHFDRGRGGDRGGHFQSFGRGNGNRGGDRQSFSRGNGNRGGNFQSFSRGNGNRGGGQSFSRGNSRGGNSFRGGSGRGSSGGSFRGGSSHGGNRGGGSRGGNRGGGSHGGGRGH